MDDARTVGGKNASLGELRRRLRSDGVRVPDGFATTSSAYFRFLEENGLIEAIRGAMGSFHDKKSSLAATGLLIREAISTARIGEDLRGAIADSYDELSRRIGEAEAVVAVRSSATAEDLPEASFAGQLESFLNVRGSDAVVDAVHRCFASAFTDRAIAYREEHGYDHLAVGISVGIQRMVRADLGGAGVLFTLDIDTGFPDLVVVTAAWGLGENVVQGAVEPDQYRVFKPFLARGSGGVIEKICGSKAKRRIYSRSSTHTTRDVATSAEQRASFVLTDDEIETLARWGAAIERHYGNPMDVEWAKDGSTNDLFIVQARPETVHARRAVGSFAEYSLRERGEVLARGLAIGESIASGRARVLRDLGDMDTFKDGEVLVAETTDPDWVPVMRRASALITEHGGRTSHAAIVSRELRVPAVVGAPRATSIIHTGHELTVDCAGGDQGTVYAGKLEFEKREVDLARLPKTRTRILLNVGMPASALAWWRLPAAGIGLARMEYVVSSAIQVHPMALAHFERVQDKKARKEIELLTRRYNDKRDYFVVQLAQAVALMAAACHPKPAIIRTSDFKTNEYRQLLGGDSFEPHEENPMLGWRGASRYYDDDYRDGFELECKAIRRVREELGFRNVVVMIPFCRTPAEADRVLSVMADQGLERGKDGLEIWVMAEIPSNVLEAEAFAERFDGFSIGSNDLTQLALGVSRDEERLRGLFDERSPTVKALIRELVVKAHASGRAVSLCGQGPSDHPELAEFLVDVGIDSISVDPDSFSRVVEHVARAERRVRAA